MTDIRISRFALALALSNAVGATHAAETLFEVTLDIDGDGRADRAEVVREENEPFVALRIFLGPGSEPAFVKRDLTADPVTKIETRNENSIAVTYGRGGSNSFETVLTITFRRGQFVVSGLTREWDMRNAQGSCDINFLTGRGVAARGLGENKPRERFRPVRLADWSEDRLPAACR